MRTADEIYKRLEAARAKISSDSFDCRAGAFMVRRKGILLSVIACDTKGWDHVSVSLAFRSPTWEEMTFIKEIFFEDEETCIQYHAAKSRYKNVHEFCRHLWRPQEIALPDPPSIIAGPERWFA